MALLDSSCSEEEQFLSARGLWTLAMKCPDEVRSEKNCVAGAFVRFLTLRFTLLRSDFLQAYRTIAFVQSSLPLAVYCTSS